MKVKVLGRAKPRFTFGDMFSHALSVLGAIILIYFGYHAFAGERNLFSLVKLSRQIEEKNAELAEVSAEREKLEIKTHGLYAKSLDKDMLDEQARSQLSYIGKNEVMVFVDKH